MIFTGCAYRSTHGSLCDGGESTFTSYSLFSKPKWSVTCSDGRAIRFESSTEAEEMRALMDNDKKRRGD